MRGCCATCSSWGSAQSRYASPVLGTAEVDVAKARNRGWPRGGGAGKSGEIGIAGDEDSAVADRERRQMGVGSQIACSAGLGKQRVKDVPVLVLLMHQARGILGQPRVDLANCGIRIQRLGKDVGIGGNTEESEQDDPGQAHRLVATEGPLPPGQDGSVVDGVFICAASFSWRSLRPLGRRPGPALCPV